MTRIALLFPALLACAAAPVPAGVELAGIRDKATVGPLKVMPLAVVEDSRCPSDNMCIWAGRVVLRVAVEGPGVRRTLMLEGHKPFPIVGGTLTMVHVDPVKTRGRPLKAGAYRFGFTFKAMPDL